MIGSDNIYKINNMVEIGMRQKVLLYKLQKQ